MKLSRSNYELWFIDYTDGKLDPSKKEELFHFLEQHPDLKEEFELFTLEEVKLDVPKAAFVGKSSLKKSAVPEVTTEQLVAYMENDLSPDEKVDLALRIESDKNSFRELALLRKTILQPDKNIVFKAKHQLKRGRIVAIRPFYRYAAIAASLVFIIAAYAFFRNLSFNERSTAESTTRPAVTNPSNKILPVETKEEQRISKDEPSMKESRDTHVENRAFADNHSKEKNVSVSAHDLAVEEHVDHLAVSQQQDIAVEEQVDAKVSNVLTTSNDKTIKNKVISDKGILVVFQLAQNPFTKEELAQFEAEKNDVQNKPLEVLARKGLKKIKDAAEITIEENEDVVEDSKTFALAIGKRFSISRTKSN